MPRSGPAQVLILRTSASRQMQGVGASVGYNATSLALVIGGLVNRASSPTRRLLVVVWIEAKLRRKCQSTSISFTFAQVSSLVLISGAICICVCFSELNLSRILGAFELGLRSSHVLYSLNSSCKC
jgi:hypothetical protein